MGETKRGDRTHLFVIERKYAWKANDEPLGGIANGMKASALLTPYVISAVDCREAGWSHEPRNGYARRVRCGVVAGDNREMSSQMCV